MLSNEAEIKCWCGEMTYSDADRIAHDCNYFPMDIIGRNELWDNDVQ